MLSRATQKVDGSPAPARGVRSALSRADGLDHGGGAESVRGVRPRPAELALGFLGLRLLLRLRDLQHGPG